MKSNRKEVNHNRNYHSLPNRHYKPSIHATKKSRLSNERNSFSNQNVGKSLKKIAHLEKKVQLTRTAHVA